MIHPGESWQSKEEEVHVLTPRINRRCAVGLWLPMCTFQFAAQPQQADEHPEKVVGGSEGPEATHPARARQRSWTCSFVMTDALGWQQSIQPSPSDQVCIHQPFPRWVKYHHNAYCLYSSSKSISMKYIILSKYIVLILCLGRRRYRELKWFNNLWNECRFIDSHSSVTGEPKKHQKQPKPPGYFTLYLFPVMSEKL